MLTIFLGEKRQREIVAREKLKIERTGPVDCLGF